ncbi:hypothetical protein BDP81DRAFT_320456 [Colletotrichum phormii]|uniref:SprT-like domain-containing protein n=1 Tax=Colletotrichum phormii TaxID=359342 RepID=A0AAI9ZQ80_9PEZI|nr:uncharacterized protein BDP81DRAFT_320456 [Colletotrichum phormii]KAK1636192.1 hypothetical protein BDP81DRAFT_320456 [Colletotrichum phormii]
MYGATPLLNLTWQNFYPCELRPQQVAARLEFVQIFLEAMAASNAWGDLTPEELEEFEQTRCSDTKLDSLACKLECSLHEMLLCLDDFFFFGALKRHPHKPAHSNDETSKYSHVHLMTGFGILKGEVADCFAESRPRYNSDRWFAEICLYPKIGDPKIPGSEVERISFAENVASLIHEMVHAYIQMFVCQRPQCERNLLDTAGLSGHGPIFMKLHTLIVETVRAWHTSLEYVDQNRCYPGTGFDLWSHITEHEAIEAYGKAGKLGRFLPLNADSPHTLIRIVKEELPNRECIYNVVCRQPASNTRQQVDPEAEFVVDEDDDDYDDDEEYQNDGDDDDDIDDL